MYWMILYHLLADTVNALPVELNCVTISPRQNLKPASSVSLLDGEIAVGAAEVDRIRL